MAMMPMEEYVTPTLVGIGSEITSARITTAGSSWTATEDCFCCGYMIRGTTDTSAYLSISGAIVAIVGSGTANKSVSQGVCAPVKKGQIVSCNGYSDSTWDIRFYKAKTS